MAYTVVLTSQAKRDLRNIDATMRRRITARIEALTDDPFPPGRKKIQGQTTDIWRIRVGDFRVLYEIGQATITILVLRVRNRKDAY